MRPDIPQDVLVRILLSCTIGDLFTWKQVCRRFLELVESDVYLQYKIELAINGMVDVSAGPRPSCPGMPVVERLAKLREYGERLRSGHFESSGFAYSWQLWPEIASEPKDGWQAFLAFGSSISYVVVKPPQGEISVCAPPLFDSQEMRHWVVPLGAFPEVIVLAVSVDIAQDLLVVVQAGTDGSGLIVHFRSLSRPNHGHGHASAPILSLSPVPELLAGNDGQSTMDQVQIHGEIVAWRVYVQEYDECVIDVWDWKSERLLWRYHYMGGASFTLLDSSRIVVITHSGDAMLVYRLDPSNARADVPLPVLALKLPPDQTEPKILESSIPVPPASSVPFWIDPAYRVVVVSSNPTRLLVPYTTFATFLERTSNRSSVNTPIAWEDWGPSTTLMMHVSGRRKALQVAHSYGSRFPTLDNTSIGTVIFDLNPWAARYAQSSRASSRGHVALDERELGLGTENAVLRHTVFSGPDRYGGFAQGPPVLSMDHGGVTKVFTRWLMPCRFLGSISYFA